MVSHAGFLRDVHSGPEDDVITLIGGLAAAAEAAAKLPLAEGLETVLSAIERLLDRAPSFLPHQALLRFSARLTLAPRTMQAAHLEPLREIGYSDLELHDAVNVVCCFSYMNRLADGLGVTAHPEPGDWAEKLLGVARVERHRRWAAGDDEPA